jgi:hypothetical protein
LETLEVAYESHASGSNIFIRAEKIIDYQMQMLTRNKIKRTAEMNVIRREGLSYCCYNITSLLTLSFFLTRRKLAKKELLSILYDISRTLIDCTDYLLDDRGYLIDSNYIYIDPESLKINMIYLPSEERERVDTVAELTNCLLDILLNKAEINDSCEKESDNYYQKIIKNLKSDNFSIKSFSQMLSEMLYGDRASVTSNYSISKNEAALTDAKDNALTDRTSLDKKNIKKNNNKNTNENKNTKHTVNKEKKYWILIQIPVIIAIAFLGKQASTYNGGGIENYIFVALIVFSLDVLLLRKFFFKSENKVNKKYDKKPDKKSSKKPAEKSDSNKNENAEKLLSMYNSVFERPESYHEEYSKNHSEKCLENYIKNSKEDLRNFDWQREGFYEHSSYDRNPSAGRAEPGLCGKTELLAVGKREYPVLQGINQDSGELILLDKSEIVVGRLRDQVDYVSTNLAVGKVHAQIIERGGAYFVRDLNSINGSYINGNRINSNLEYDVKEGDIVSFADSSFVFHK